MIGRGDSPAPVILAFPLNLYFNLREGKIIQGLNITFAEILVFYLRLDAGSR